MSTKSGNITSELQAEHFGSGIIRCCRDSSVTGRHMMVCSLGGKAKYGLRPDWQDEGFYFFIGNYVPIT